MVLAIPLALWAGAMLLPASAADDEGKVLAQAEGDDDGNRRRDGDAPRQGPRDGDRPRPEGQRDGDRPPVLVYDEGGNGGIHEGPIGLMTEENFRIYEKANEEEYYYGMPGLIEFLIEVFN
jgi:hypothetical protein